MTEKPQARQHKTYPSEESAQRRVAQLQALGYWPGVVPVGDRWRLTHDPDTAATRPHRTAESAS